MTPHSPRIVNEELLDFDLDGKKILKEPLDVNSIWNQLSEISLSSELISILKRYYQDKDTKHVISLAGGGAKGLVGNFVLIYLLDQLNLMDNIDEIWGVSAGSIIGAAYCIGLKPIEILNLLVGIRNRDFLHFKGEGMRKGGGFLHHDKFHEYFDIKLKHRFMSDCIKPFYVIAVKFDGHMEQVHVFEKGLISDIITASMSVQNVFEPTILDGSSYIDGGLIETTPSISIVQRHRKLNDLHQLAILGTCFGETHFETTHRTMLGQARNLIGVYQYQLTLEQMERVHQMPNCSMGMIRLNIEIGGMDFGNLGNFIVPAYQQLVDKISIMAMHRNFNQLV